jgi:3D (Asp-Asp-Asp) domain-containing protein
MRLRHPLRLGITTLAVTTALGAASVIPAMAASSPVPSPSSSASSASCSGSAASVLACIKQRAATAISDRESALQKMTTDVNGSAGITSSDKSTLLGQIQADESGLTALNATIQGDTTVAQARADAQTIVTGYRVYLLEEPKVHLVIAADTEGAVESRISSVLPALQTAINDSTASAANKAKAQTAFNDCSSQLAAAQSASSGIASEVIDLLPSGYPGNQPTLVSARQSAKTARQDLGTCRTDINTIRSALGI